MDGGQGIPKPHPSSAPPLDCPPPRFAPENNLPQLSEELGAWRGLLSGEDDTLRRKANPALSGLNPPQEMPGPRGQASRRAWVSPWSPGPATASGRVSRQRLCGVRPGADPLRRPPEAATRAWNPGVSDCQAQNLSSYSWGN